jgi:arylsulfatase
MTATYSGMMESEGHHIGMLLDYLGETGDLDETLIVYMSDNGPEALDVQGDLSNPGFTAWVRASFRQEIDHIGRGDAFGFIGTNWVNASTSGLKWWKWFIGEGGIRVPFLVVPPRGSGFARRGPRTAAFASVKDAPMTILEYAGVELAAADYEGREIAAPSGVSMRPFLEGPLGAATYRRSVDGDRALRQQLRDRRPRQGDPRPPRHVR